MGGILRDAARAMEQGSALAVSERPGLGGRLLGAIGWPSALVRRVLGTAIGAEPLAGDRAWLLGEVPTGADLLTRLTGWPEPGARGLGSAAAGFAVEMATDPLMYLGIGVLSRAGKTAAALDNLQRTQRALAAVGRAEDAAALAPRIAALSGELRAAGAPLGLARGFERQGQLGQRALLSLFGRPLVRAPQVLGGLERIGGLAARPFRGIYRELFAPSGRLGIPAYDALVDVSRATQAAARGAGGEERAALQRLAKAHPVSAEEMGRIGDLMRRAAREAWAGVERAWPGHSRMSVKEFERLRPLFEWPEELARIGSGQENAVRLLRLALQKDIGRSARERIAKLEADLAVKLQPLRELRSISTESLTAEELKAWGAKVAALTGRKRAPKTVEKGTAALDKTIANLTRRATREMTVLEQQGQLGDAFVAALPEPLRGALASRRLFYDDMLKQEIARGVPVSYLADPTLGYLPRIARPAALDAARRLPEGSPFARFARLYNPERGFSRARIREWDGLTHYQINEMWRRSGMRGDFFVEDLGDIALRRAVESGRARSAAELLAGTVQLFHQPAEAAAAGSVPVEKFLALSRLRTFEGARLGSSAAKIAAQLKGTPFEGARIPADIARAALAIDRVVTVPRSLQKAVAFTDAVHGILRHAVTQPIPAYHARNMIGNGFLMFLAGMRDPADWWRGITLAWRVARGKATDAEMALWREAVEHGSVGATLARETREIAGEALGRLQRLPLVGPESRLGRAAAQFGSILEDGSKMALFMWAKRQGYSAQEAGALTRKYLFDYGDLSAFERAVMRRMVYFYTFARKAVPLLLTEMAQHPGLASGYVRATGMAPGNRPQQLFLPPWMRAAGQLYAGEVEGEPSFVAPDLPPSEIFSLLSTEGRGAQRVLQRLAGRLAPLPRAAIEYATQVSLRTGRPFPGGTLAPLQALLPTARLTAPVERAIQVEDPKEALAGFWRLLWPLGRRPRSESLARIEVQLSQIDRELAELAGKGRARRSLQYAPVEQDESARRLNSLRAVLLRERAALLGRRGAD